MSLDATVSLLLGLSAISAVGLGMALLRWRSEPGGLFLVVTCGAIAVWASSNAVQINSSDRDLKRFTVTLAFACICATIYSFWRAIMARAPWPWRVPAVAAILLGAPAIVTIVLVSATDAPGPFFRELDIPSGPGPVVGVPGPWLVLHLLWAYGLMIWALVGFGWLALQAPHGNRRLSILMIAAVAAPLATNAVLATGAAPLRGHDPTPIAALLAIAGLAWAVRRLRMLDVEIGLMPIARDTVVESMGEGVLVVDRRGRVVDINPAAVDLLSLGNRLPIAHEAADVVPGWPGDDPAASLWEFRSPHGPSERVIEARTETLGGRGRRDGVLLLLRDVTEQRDAQATLERSAAQHLRASQHDPLTGLPNRTMLFSRLRAELDGGGGCALLILDLDGFKALNDTFGHRAGDRVLRELAVRLENAADRDALVARLAGDEFAVVLSPPEREQAVATAERLLGVFRLPFTAGGTEVTLEASIGLAFGPKDGADADDLVHAADVAMYDAKRTAGRWAVYHPDLDARRPERLILRHELQRALREGELVLHYQPQATPDGRVQAVEALVRWMHPERGLLMPGAFLPVTEDTDLICRLTDEVLKLALGSLARWRLETPDLRVSVNVSSLDIRDPSLPERVMDALAHAHLPPRALTLEITENALMVARDGAGQLGLLRAEGLRVALDDFGTGMGPLTTLRELPVDELKIDRSFVSAMDGHARDIALVGSLIRMGHDLGLSVVAEGVETPAGVSALRDLGCDLLQGYLVGRPGPFEALSGSRIDLAPAA